MASRLKEGNAGGWRNLGKWVEEMQVLQEVTVRKEAFWLGQKWRSPGEMIVPGDSVDLRICPPNRTSVGQKIRSREEANQSRNGKPNPRAQFMVVISTVWCIII